MEKQIKKVFAFDLDGTLTEHRTWITDENLAVLDSVKEKGIRPVMIGAGQVRRIHTQMREYPIDIIGNYGLQYAVYREETGILELMRDLTLPCDTESVRERIEMLRDKFGFTEYAGESVEFHPSGCVTFPILGTKAEIADKLLFDPDRAIRRALYDEVAAAFPEYTVFVGGSSSFDMAPMPHNKYYALDTLCREEGYTHAELTYFGDDYGKGGNDEAVYQSDIDFVKVDDYRKLPEIMETVLASL
ncbi:MAG: HAD family phosphatase [Clostridia bacterium]|nr:HAD family phosphatase [Clostridia bacterium]